MNNIEALQYAISILQVDEEMHYEGKPHDEAIELLTRLADNPDAREFYEQGL